MAQFPEFDKAFLRFLHKRVSEETLITARSLGGKVETMTRESLEAFDINKTYDSLLKESPTLLTVLHSASSKEKITSIQV